MRFGGARLDFGIFGCGCGFGWFGSVSSLAFSLRFCGERLDFGIFGCAVVVAVRLARHSALSLSLDVAELN